MNRFCWTLMAIGGLALVCAPTAGQNLLSNPSFEAGDAAPQGWHVLDGGVWSASSARTGRKCLAGKRPSKAVVWQSALVDLNPAQAGLAGARQSYRLSGWVKCRSGEAALVMEFLDDRGAFLGRAATPIAKPKRAWQFVAVEADAPQRASSARVSLAVEGEAYADDLVLAPLTANLLFNPGFEGDDRGRVGYWGDDPLLVLPGERVGAHRADTEQGRSGSALLVEAPQGWWPVRCVKIPVPTGLTQFRFAGWGRVAQGEAEILVEWIDDFETIVRVDKALATAVENGWTRFERVGMSAPSNAAYVTVTVVVRNGVARFDDFVLCAEAPASNKRPVVEVQVNQVGYEAEGPKTLVVQSNFLPKQPDEVTVRIINEDGARVAELRPACAGRINEGTRDDWGWYFWRADFSRLTQPGRYRALARVGEVERESPTFVLGSQVLTAETAKLALDFFFVQRCGYEVPGWHKACHLDDALLPDGTHIDATGGWHSAGDYNKLMYEYGDGGVVYALLAAYGAAPERWRRFDRDGDGVADVLDEAEWGARFVAKMQIPETGGLRNHVHQGPGREWMKWTAPEVHTDNLVGTPDDPVIQEGEGSSPLVIGGWARLSVLLNERGVQNDYLQRAVRLWNHATAGGAGLGSPLLLLSAMELHAVTGEDVYLEWARRSVEALLAGQVRAGRHAGAFGAYGEVNAGALAAFALRYPAEPLSGRVREALSDWVSFAASTARNPFGLSKQRVGEPEFFFEPTSSLGHNWELLQRAWAGRLIWRLTGDVRALRYAADQVDWILGKNPLGLCMFEGKGAFNPPRYHHRYDAIPGRERGAVPGCIPNGFVRSAAGEDKPGFDLSRTRKERDHPSYRTNEPWLVHNLWYLLLLSTEGARS